MSRIITVNAKTKELLKKLDGALKQHQTELQTYQNQKAVILQSFMEQKKMLLTGILNQLEEEGVEVKWNLNSDYDLEEITEEEFHEMQNKGATAVLESEPQRGKKAALSAKKR